MAGPLDHLVVIDASLAMPGAIASMLLADHGADVTKVEPHGGAFYAHDLTRKSWDRGKRSVELDIFGAADLQKLKGLLAGADLLIHSLASEEARLLGLDEASLAAAFPALVVVSLSAYGQNTPLSGRPYGESLAAARLGTMVDKGSQLRPGPVYLGHPALHYGQAFLAVIGALAALQARHMIGTGQLVDASLLDSMAAQSPMNNWWQEDGVSYIKAGDAGAIDRFGSVRLMTAMFECGDGLFLQVHTGGASAFKRAMDILGFADRIRDVGPNEMSVPLDEDEYQVARVEVFEAFKAKPRDEWIALFQEADVAALPVLEPAEVLLDPQTEFVGQRIELPDADFGTIHQAGPAIRFAKAQPAMPKPAPAVGADNGLLGDLIARKARAAGEAKRKLARPLEGVRLVDFSSFFAVGYGGRLLSDLGADVIKVESPGGDQMRPLPDPFSACQRGKRAIVLDLKKPEALEAALRLADSADIITHNQRPGKADKLGIGYEALSKRNPRLVYAYLPGYGSTGPKSLLKSFAPLVSGWTGLLYEGGGEGNRPTRSVFGNEDYNNGFLGAVGILMALERRAITGEGDYLECPQLHSSLWTTSEHFLDANREPVYGLRLDAEQAGFDALDRIYQTADGWVCICCRSDDRFAALACAVGMPGLLTDADFGTAKLRTSNDAKLLAALRPWFAAQTSAEAFEALDAAGAAAELVRDTSWVREFLQEEWALKSNRVVENLDTMYGHTRELGVFTHLSKTPALAAGSAPRLGEHTREILSEVGYSAEEIDAMIAARIAAVPKIPTGRIDGNVRVSAA